MATMTQRGVEGVSSSVGRCHRVPMHCYRLEDAKEKKFTVNIYWVPGVNHLGSHSRSAFAEFTDVSAMQEDCLVVKSHPPLKPRFPMHVRGDVHRKALFPMHVHADTSMK